MTEDRQTVTVERHEDYPPQYRLAGLGTRFIAYIIDRLIQTGVILGLVMVILLLFILSGAPTSITTFFVKLWDFLGWWVIGLIILVYEIMTTGYFVLFEWLWKGATPGKRSQEIRVIREDGRPVSFLAALLRNVLRVVDITVDIYPLGLVVMFIDSRNRRLGDVAARTLVVMDRDLKSSLVHEHSEAPDMNYSEIRNAVQQMTVEDYDLVRKFLARRDTLDINHRQDLAKEILRGVSRKSLSVENVSNPEALLEKLEALFRQTG
jgi:uncharacterized RDD family membrane protein YckC